MSSATTFTGHETYGDTGRHLVTAKILGVDLEGYGETLELAIASLQFAARVHFDDPEIYADPMGFTIPNRLLRNNP